MRTYPPRSVLVACVLPWNQCPKSSKCTLNDAKRSLIDANCSLNDAHLPPAFRLGGLRAALYPVPEAERLARARGGHGRGVVDGHHRVRLTRHRARHGRQVHEHRVRPTHGQAPKLVVPRVHLLDDFRFSSKKQLVLRQQFSEKTTFKDTCVRACVRACVLSSAVEPYPYVHISSVHISCVHISCLHVSCVYISRVHISCVHTSCLYISCVHNRFKGF
jgi:hypothetical protein